MNLIFSSIKMSAFHWTKQYFRLINITSLSGCIKYQQILFDNVMMGHNWSRDCINFLLTYYIIGYYVIIYYITLDFGPMCRFRFWRLFLVPFLGCWMWMLGCDCEFPSGVVCLLFCCFFVFLPKPKKNITDFFFPVFIQRGMD